jgi:hypothetical protein
MCTAEEVYESSVRRLSVTDRLKLAAIILENLARSSPGEWRDAWSDEDLRELTAASPRHAVNLAGPDECA